MDRKPTRFELRLPPELSDEIDRWRREQPDLPPRAEAARRLIELGLEATATASQDASRASEMRDLTKEHGPEMISTLQDVVADEKASTANKQGARHILKKYGHPSKPDK